MAPEPISTLYFINPSHQSACLYVWVPLSLLGNGWVKKNVTAATSTHATTEEMPDELLLVRVVSRDVLDCFSPELPLYF
jgi:hypothetical protein